jgi:hypothetical protein
MLLENIYIIIHDSFDLLFKCIKIYNEMFK